MRSKLTDEELKKAFFILRHGSEEGLSEYIKAVLAIENEYDRQKAEIERLTQENKNLSIKVWNYERPARTPLYSSESMVNCNLVTCYNENADLKAKNAELQKQVDELTKKIIARESVFHNLVIVEKDKSVKATAKEIFILAEDYNCGYESDMDNFMRELKERYGVEVE